MNSLRELQIYFQSALLQLKEKSTNILDISKLNIYQNSIQTKHFKALKKLYPAIHKLVGESFFKQLNRDYRVTHPSLRWSLSEYGGSLPHFLLRYPSVQHLAYLPEVARLEWAIHEVIQDGQSRLLTFNFPVLDIWRFCQGSENRKDILHLKSRGQNIMLKLKQSEVEMQLIRQRSLNRKTSNPTGYQEHSQLNRWCDGFMQYQG